MSVQVAKLELKSKTRHTAEKKKGSHGDELPEGLGPIAYGCGYSTSPAYFSGPELQEVAEIA